MKRTVADSLTSCSRFVKQHLGASGPTCEDTEALQREVIDLRQRCTRLTEENKDLKTRVNIICLRIYLWHLNQHTV